MHVSRSAAVQDSIELPHIDLMYQQHSMKLLAEWQNRTTLSTGSQVRCLMSVRIGKSPLKNFLASVLTSEFNHRRAKSMTSMMAHFSLHLTRALQIVPRSCLSAIYGTNSFLCARNARYIPITQSADHHWKVLSKVVFQSQRLFMSLNRGILYY